MGRAYWMVVLVPCTALVVLFLISSCMPHLLRQPLQSHWNQLDQSQSTSEATSKALAFLAHQEVEFLAEMNSSAVSNLHSNFVKKQQTLNAQLQRILTSSYGGASELATSTVCQKAGSENPMATREGIAWHPNGNRYLVMICNSGQVTNHLICLQKHMYFGALLSRTLVLPHGSLDYKYEHLLDIDHLKQCLGNASIVTFAEFEEARGKNLHIDMLICYMHDCYFDKEHQTKWEALGFTFGKRQDAWSSSSTKPSHHHDSILSSFGCEEQVIAVGDLFYAEVENWDSIAVGHMCRSLVQPHRTIVATAQRFVQTYLGLSFLAVHFRRHGFLVFCNRQKRPSCFYPVPQAARCIVRKVREARADVVYLSTDAPASEVGVLTRELEREGVTVVRRSGEHEADAKWDAMLWREGPGREAEGGVMAMVDKTVCAMGLVFVGTRESSFSADIQRMRLAMGSASSCDAPLCHGLPLPLRPPLFLLNPISLGASYSALCNTLNIG